MASSAVCIFDEVIISIQTSMNLFCVVNNVVATLSLFLNFVLRFDNAICFFNFMRPV